MKKIKESILDPVHDELNPNLWDNMKLKSEVKDYIIKQVDEWMSTVFEENSPQIDNLLIAGSITGFQYISTSDIDVKIQLDLPDAKISELFRLLPNGIDLPGTKHPVNYYILNKKFDLVNKGAVYDILNEKWLVEPKKGAETISMPYIVELAKIFMVGIDDRIREYERDIQEVKMYQSYLKSDAYDKKEVEQYIERKKVEIEAGLDGLNIIFDMIWKFRDEAYQTTENPRDFFMFDKTLGHYSIQNQVYKLLEKFGYLDLLKKYNKLRKEFMKSVEKNLKKVVVSENNKRLNIKKGDIIFIEVKK
jgi:hypothetical protein